MDKVIVEVIVDRDPVPGVFHTEKSIMETIQTVLDDRIGHYHPKVQDAYPKAGS